MQRDPAVWLLRKHPFNRLEVLEEVMVEVLAQTQKQK